MEFIDPPPTTKGQRGEDWRNRVMLMKSKPTEWALVGDYSPGVATHIRRGQYKAFLPADCPPDAAEAYMTVHWDVTTRKRADGRNDLWIRWLG
jgi:hypothetical protein